jgi:hypothetical protein
MNSERLDELCTGFLEGDLSDAECGEFQALLEAQPGSLTLVADRYEIHRALGQLFQPHDSSAFARATIARICGERDVFIGALKSQLRTIAPVRKDRLSLLFAAGLAAAVLCVTAVSVALFYAVSGRPENARNAIDAPPPAVATLVRSAGVRWEPDIAVLNGQRLSAGPLRLGTGRAVLQFDNGAIVAVQAPAHLQLESRSLLRVDQGRVAVRAEGDAAGFTVRTPAGDAQDLGTEFSVSVQVSGEAEIHVQQGEVAWLAEPAAPPTRILHAGEAARFDSTNKTQGHSIVFVAQTLDDFLRQFAANLQADRCAAYEGFDYPVGEQALETCGGGFGWKNPWRLRRGEERTREADMHTDFTIDAGSLSFPSAEKSGGGALQLPPGQSYRVRELVEPIDLNREAIYYLSFLLRRDAAVNPNPKGFPHFRLTLRRSTDFWGPSVTVGLPASRHPTLQLYSRDSFVAPLSVENGVTTLWVLKIVAHRGRPDEAFLKVFNPGEPLPAFEPAPWSVVADRFPADGLLDLVVVTGSGPLPYVFDELRVGRTWDSVARKE